MRRLILLLLGAVAMGEFFAKLLRDNGPGYVWIYYNDYSIETSFWFFLLFLVVIILLFYGAYKLTVNVFYLSAIPKRLGLNRANQLQQQGLIAYSEASWQQAEVTLAKLFKKQQSFGIALLAARAALAQGDFKQCERHYGQARNATNAQDSSLRLLRLDIDLARGNIAAVRDNLNQLISDFPQRLSLNEMALSFYLKQKNWLKAEPHFIKLNKKSTNNNERLRRQGIALYEALMADSLTEKSSQFNNHYQSLQKLIASDSEQQHKLEKQLVRYVIQQGDDKRLKKMIQQMIKRQQYGMAADSLVLVSDEWFSDELIAWQEKLQKVYEHQHNDSGYLHLLAVLSLRMQQLSQARDYYLKSLSLVKNNQLLLELAAVHKRQGQLDKALQCMEQITCSLTGSRQ